MTADHDAFKPLAVTRELQPYTERLEALVAARTLALQETNDQLRREIEERKRVEAALRDSEALHQAMFSHISDAIFITDDAGVFTFICPTVDMIFGYSKAEVEHFTGIDSLLGDALFDPAALGTAGEISNIEREITDKGGCRHTLLVTVKRVAIGGGTVLYCCRDITARKQAEEKALENEALFRVALEAADSGGWDFDIATGAYQFSDRALQDCRYRPEEVEHTVDFLEQLIHPEDLSGFRTAYVNHVTGHAPFFEYDYRLRCGDGTYRWIESRGAVVKRDADGRALRMVGVNMDITARKLTEAALKDSETRYRTLVEGSLQGIIIFDQDNRCVFANTTLVDILGYDHAQGFVGRSLNDCVVPRDQARLERYRQARLRGEPAPTRYELQVKRKDGTFCWLLVLSSPLEWEGQPARMATVLDITEQKQLEQDLIRLSEQEQRRLGQELHDGLGQVLTGTALVSRMLADQLAGEAHPGAAEAAQVADWVHQALVAAHDVAHGLYPEVLASQGLGRALESLAVQAERLFGLTCNVAGDIPDDLMTPTAALHLYRLAQEAVTNAAKHSQAKVVTLQADVTPEYLYLSVRDNGVGIPDHLEMGAGMGLRNMRTRAIALEATLEIKRLAQGGTEITCTVPLDANAHA